MGSPNYGQLAKQNEKQRKKLVTEGEVAVNKAFDTFTPEFYNERARAYENFAMPQLANQFQQTRNAQLFGLANRGLLGGSASQQAFSDLNRKMAQNKQQIVDTGIGQAQDLERQVQGSKTGLLNMVYSGADPAQATYQASQAAAGFKPNSVMAPITNMFADIANQYYTNQLLNQYRQGYQTSAPSLYGSASALPPTSSSK